MPDQKKELQQGQTLLADGSAGGVHVRAVQHSPSPYDVTIEVDGIHAPVTAANLYRDGGTRVLETAHGTLRLPRRLRDDDHRPRWNGEVLA